MLNPCLFDTWLAKSEKSIESGFLSPPAGIMEAAGATSFVSLAPKAPNEKPLNGLGFGASLTVSATGFTSGSLAAPMTGVETNENPPNVAPAPAAALVESIPFVLTAAVGVASFGGEKVNGALVAAVVVVVVTEEVGMANENVGLPRSKVKLADVTGALVFTSAVVAATTPNLTGVAAA